VSKDSEGTRYSPIAGSTELKSVFDQIPDMIYVKDLDGRFLFANRTIVSNNGLSELEDLVGRTDFDFLSDDVAQMATDVERQVAETGQPHFGCEELAFRGEDERWLMITRVPFRDASGKTVGIVGVSRDITAQKSAARLKDAQSCLLEMIARDAPLGTVLEELARVASRLDHGLHLVFVVQSSGGETSPQVFAPTLGYQFDDIAGKRIASVEPADLNSIAVTVGDAVSGLQCWQGSSRSKSFPIASGKQIDGMMIQYSVSEADRPDVIEFLSIAMNIAGIAIARHRAVARIGYLAEHDPLTGMANRALLDKRLTASIEAAAASREELALAFLDLDNFKLVNDSLGHSVGDELLRVIARRVCDLTKDYGTIARIGGDEFVIILQGKTAERPLQQLSEIREAVTRPVLVAGTELQVTCSIGVASYPKHGKSAEELLGAADMAMYRVKEAGRDGVAVFDQNMATEVRNRHSKIEELRQAIIREEFVLYFQPQVDARSGRVVGAEALIRWDNPKTGLISPRDFIPLAEETGQIVAMGEWVIANACRQAMAWQNNGLEPIRISVNVSARHFQHARLIETVSAAIQETQLDPNLLELEITESLIMKDLAGSVARMHELTALGIGLAIDDFGTGYSSLSALKKFPLSRLKIDRSFIAELPESAEDAAITSAIILMSQKLGIEVIAEGVESVSQAKFLVEEGCPEIQGYVFSKPLTASDFFEFALQRNQAAQQDAA
jgi:diguanylate cyclase (GGDEF)-like protein/PAS domain S-box-containing protein